MSLRQWGPVLRLVGGTGSCSGRLEVFHQGRWGTVCDDMWALPGAAVVCRELGCGDPLSAPRGAFFGEGSGPIWLDNVRCQGNESALSRCLPWGDSNCTHREDAGVVCSGNLRLRLTCRRHACGGSVGPWLQWSCRSHACGRSAARAAPVDRPQGCLRQLHWSHRPRDPPQERLRQLHRSHGISMRGGEMAVLPAGPGVSPHSPRAGVPAAVFALPEVRLVGGPHRCAGPVEVQLDGPCGTVCDDSWDLGDVAVVCRQLGCGRAMEALSGKVFSQGNESHLILMTNVQCQGTEAVLRSCPYEDPGDLCQHDEDAGARCQGEPVRLVGGPHRCAGRVEVRLDGHWGTVCDDGWDLDDVAVVCRQLGCGPALKSLTSKVYGPGSESDPVLMMDVQCQGTEAALGNCSYTDPGYLCQHDEDAGAHSVELPTPPVRLVGNNTRCSGQVEIYYDGRWGAVCGLGWDLTDAKVLCRELGCGSPRYVTHHCSKLSRSSAPVLLGQLDCTGREASLTQCQAQAWEGRHCPHHRDTGVISSEPPCAMAGALSRQSC
uniref:Soluble scavenger receptor cysteine-rich domain-containing protein SSC5D n=1 Tax=Chelonoidis abingdonii TaxID=106734 RepID=A0A8C0GX97_CHEAB